MTGFKKIGKIFRMFPATTRVFTSQMFRAKISGKHGLISAMSSGSPFLGSSGAT